MPIELHVVSEDKYASWLVKAKKEFAMEDDNNSRVVKKNKIKEKM